jgi:hypothetical protein
MIGCVERGLHITIVTFLRRMTTSLHIVLSLLPNPLDHCYQPKKQDKMAWLANGA